MRVKHRREGKYNFIFFNAGGTADYEDSPRDRKLSWGYFYAQGSVLPYSIAYERKRKLEQKK